jgi:Spy/CpxP family protein refolding chaperone
MKQTRVQLLLIGLTVLALSAGVVAGMVASRVAPAKVESTTPRTPLEDQLGLSPDQREQMRVIWEGVRWQAQHCFTDGEDLQHQRDAALVSLLTDDQKARYEKITADYAKKFAELSAQRDAAFNDAVARTKKILTETQQKKYDQLLANRVERPRP